MLKVQYIFLNIKVQPILKQFVLSQLLAYYAEICINTELQNIMLKYMLNFRIISTYYTEIYAELLADYADLSAYYVKYVFIIYIHI